MLVHYEYPDVEMFDEVASGIHLAGAAPAVPAFDPYFNQPRFPLKSWPTQRKHPA